MMIARGEYWGLGVFLLQYSLLLKCMPHIVLHLYGNECGRVVMNNVGV